MQPRPVDAARDGVQALVDEGMPEPEPPPGLGRDDQPRGDRGLQVYQQMFRVQADHAFEQFRLDLPARDRGDEEQRLGVAGKPADPAQQHVADAAGHVERPHINGGQRAAPVFAADEPD